MDSRRIGADDRGELSETAAVGVLVGLTVLMVLSAGLYVVAVDTGEAGPAANFTYDYDADADALVVRFSGGDEFPAGSVLLESDDAEATWAALSRKSGDERLQAGDAVQLSSDGTWGRPITDATELRVHAVENGSRTRLSNWTA